MKSQSGEIADISKEIAGILNKKLVFIGQPLLFQSSFSSGLESILIEVQKEYIELAKFYAKVINESDLQLFLADDAMREKIRKQRTYTKIYNALKNRKTNEEIHSWCKNNCQDVNEAIDEMKTSLKGKYEYKIQISDGGLTYTPPKLPEPKDAFIENYLGQNLFCAGCYFADSKRIFLNPGMKPNFVVTFLHESTHALDHMINYKF